MAKAYVCDACGVTMKDPFEANMREFYVGVDFDFACAFPVNVRAKKTVHLCVDCFHGLREVAFKGRQGSDEA